MASPTAQPRSWRASLRVILITMVLFSQAVDALPLPIFSERQLAHAVGQQELQRWQRWLAQMGVERSTAQLASAALTLSDRARTVESTLQAPLDPLRPVLGIDQNWTMFAFVDPRPGGLLVDMQTTDGTWVSIYPETTAGHALARQLRYRRLRAVYDAAGDRRRPGALYDRFAQWTARRVFALEEEATVVRLRMRHQMITLPWQSPKPASLSNERRISREGSTL